jgi:hypothetical protein
MFASCGRAGSFGSLFAQINRGIKLASSIGQILFQFNTLPNLLPPPSTAPMLMASRGIELVEIDHLIREDEDLLLTTLCQPPKFPD